MPKNSAYDKSRWRNVLSIGLVGFLVAVLFSGPIGAILQRVGPFTAVLVIVGTIAFAVLADILAVAATAGRDAPLNAMASDRVPGAREALIIVRNAGRVNSICGDVIGDVAGTMTGVVATPIIFAMQNAYPEIPSSLSSMIVIGLIAFFTIGAKAAEKSFAVNSSTTIILAVGKIIYYAKRLRTWTGQLMPRTPTRPGSNRGA